MINGYITITLRQCHLLNIMISPQDCDITQTLPQEKKSYLGRLYRLSINKEFNMQKTIEKQIQISVTVDPEEVSQRVLLTLLTSVGSAEMKNYRKGKLVGCVTRKGCRILDIQLRHQPKKSPHGCCWLRDKKDFTPSMRITSTWAPSHKPQAQCFLSRPQDVTGGGQRVQCDIPPCSQFEEVVW